MKDETTTTRKRKNHRTPDPNRIRLRTYDLTARWGVTRQTLYTWRQKGLLPDPDKIGPNTYAWPREVIEEFERKRAEAS